MCLLHIPNKNCRLAPNGDWRAEHRHCRGPSSSPTGACNGAMSRAPASRFAPDLLLEEAVSSEPVSGREFPV